MLAQGTATDPKCKLNILSCLALPHPLDGLTCAKYFMIIVLLMQVIGGWEGWGWLIYISVWVGAQWVGITFFLFFVLLLIVLS